MRQGTDSVQERVYKASGSSANFEKYLSYSKSIASQSISEDIQIASMQQQISKIFTGHQGKRQLGLKTLMESQDVKIKQDNADFYVDIRICRKQNQQLRDKIISLETENLQLKQHCHKMSNVLKMHNLNIDVVEKTTEDWNTMETKPGKIVQYNQQIYSQKTYQKQLGQIEQEYKQRLILLEKQNQFLLQEVESLQKSLRLRGTNQTQQQIRSLQSSLNRKDTQISKLLQLLNQAKNSINLLELPTELLSGRADRERDDHTNRQSIPEVRVEIKQIPVYIEKQVIREVPIPLYIVDSGNQNGFQAGKLEGSLIGSVVKMNGSLRQSGKKIEAEVQSGQQELKLKEQQSLDQLQRSIHMLQIPHEILLNQETITLLQLPTEIEVHSIHPFQKQLQQQLQMKTQHETMLNGKIQSLENKIKQMTKQMAEILQHNFNLQHNVTILELPVQLSLPFASLQQQTKQQQQINENSKVQSQKAVLHEIVIMQLPVQVQIPEYYLMEVPTQIKIETLIPSPNPQTPKLYQEYFAGLEEENEELKRKISVQQQKISQGQGLYLLVQQFQTKIEEIECEKNQMIANKQIDEQKELKIKEEIQKLKHRIVELEESQKTKEQQLLIIKEKQAERDMKLQSLKQYNHSQLIESSLNLISTLEQQVFDIKSKLKQKQKESKLFEDFVNTLISGNKKQATSNQKGESHEEIYDSAASFENKLNALRNILIQKSDNLALALKQKTYLEEKISFIEKQVLPQNIKERKQLEVTVKKLEQQIRILITQSQERDQLTKDAKDELRMQEKRWKQKFKCMQNEIENVGKIKDAYIQDMQRKFMLLQEELCRKQIEIVEIPIEVQIMNNASDSQEIKVIEIPTEILIHEETSATVNLLQVPIELIHEIKQKQIVQIPKILTQQTKQNQQLINEKQKLKQKDEMITIFEIPIEVIRQVKQGEQNVIIQEKQIIKEVPVIKQIEIIREVPIVKVELIQIPVEIIRQVVVIQKELIQIPVEVFREVRVVQKQVLQIPVQIIKEIGVIERQVLQIPVQLVKETKIVEKQLIEIPVQVMQQSKIVEKELIQVPVEIIKQVRIIEKEVIEIPVENMTHEIVVQKQIVDRPVQIVKQIKVVQKQILQVPVEVEIIKEVKLIQKQIIEVPIQVKTIQQKTMENIIQKQVAVQPTIHKQLIEIPVEVIKVQYIQKPIQIIKEVYIVEKQIIQIPVEVIKQVYVEVVRQVPVVKEVLVVEKQIIQIPVEIKRVEKVELNMQSLQEKVRIIEVPVEVIKEVYVEVVREVPVVKEVLVVEKEIIQIPVEIKGVAREEINMQSSQEKVRIIEVPVEVIRETIREVPVYIIKQSQVDKQNVESQVKIIQIPIQIPIQIIREVVQLIQIPIQIPVQVIREVKIVEEVPIYIDRQVVHLIEIPIQVQTINQEIKLIQIPIQIPIQQLPTLAQNNQFKTLTNLIDLPQGNEQNNGSRSQKYLSLHLIADQQSINSENIHLLEIPTQQIIIKEVPLKVVEKQVIREVEVEKFVIKEIQKEVVKKQEVYVMVQVPVEVAVQVIVQKFVEKVIEVPVQKVVEKIVQRVVEKQVQKIVQKIVEKTVVEQKEVIREIPVQIKVIEQVEKKIFIEVPTIKQIIKQVQVPVEVQVIREIPVQIIRQIIKQVPVQVVKEVEKIVEKIVEKQVDKIVEVQVQKIVEKIVEKEIEKQVINYIPQTILIQVVREVPVVEQRIVEKFIEIVKQVPVELKVIQQVIKQVQVPKQVKVIEYKEIIKEIPVQLAIYKTVQVSNQQAMRYGETVSEKLSIIATICNQILGSGQDYEEQEYVQNAKNLRKVLHQQIFEVEKLAGRNTNDTQTQMLQNQDLQSIKIKDAQKQSNNVIQVVKEVIKQIQVIKQVPVEVDRPVTQQSVLNYIRQCSLQTIYQILSSLNQQILHEYLLQQPQELLSQLHIQIKEHIPTPEVQVRQIVKQIPIETIREIVKEVQVPFEIIKEIQVEVPVQVIKEIIKQVPVQVVREVIKQVPVEVTKEIIKQMPVEVIKETIKQVPVQVVKETIKQVVKEVIKEVPVQIVRQIIKQVPVEVTKEVIKQVPVEVIKEIIKQVPFEVTKEIIKQVPVEVIRQVCIEKPIQIIKEIQKPPIIEIKYVEKPVEVIKQVEVVKYVQKPIQIIKNVEKIVEVVKFVDRPVQVIRQVRVQVDKSHEEINKNLSRSDGMQRSHQKQRATSHVASNHHSQFSHSQQIPPLNIPADITSRSNPSSSRSSRSNQGAESRRQFYNTNGNSTIKLNENQINTQILQKYQEREKQLTQENSYLLEQVEIMGNTIGKLKAEVDGYRRDLVIVTQDYESLRKQLQEKSFSKNKSMELESKLKVEIQVKHNLEKKIKNYEIELENYQYEKQRLEREIEQQKEQRRSLQTQIRQTQSYCQSLQKSLEQKTFTIADYERDTKTLKQCILELQSRQQESIEKKNSLEDEINYLKQQIIQRDNRIHLNEDEEEIKLQVEDARKIKQIMEETERNYRNQIAQLQERYAEILSEYKAEINRLNEEVHRLAIQSETKVVSSPTKIQDTILIRRLEDENTQLKKTVQILNTQISNLKRKTLSMSQHQIKRHEDNQNQNSNSVLKSISFSSQNRLMVPQQNIGLKKRNSAMSKIRIQDIYEDEQSDNTFQRLTNMANEYRDQLEVKDKQIIQMNKVIASYQQTIERLEYENKNKSFGTIGLHSSGQIRDRSSRFSNDKMSLNMNVYVSNILRKLNIAEENLAREKSQKLRYSMRVRELQKQLQSEVLVSHVNHSYEDDSQLMEQMVTELENYKIKNDQLVSEIMYLRQQLNRPNNAYDPLLRRDSYFSYDSNVEDELSLELLDNETLLRQVKIYKAEYYKALNINRDLRSQIKMLHEKLKAQNNCTSHIETISYLSKKVDEYENSVIPRLKQQIKKCRSSYRESSYRDFSDISDNLLKGQESPNFSRRDEPERKRISTLRPGVEVSRASKKLEFQEQEHEKFVDLPQQILPAQDSTLQQINDNFSEVMKLDMEIEMKYILTQKIIQFARSLIQNDQIQSLCPQRIFVLHYSTKNTERIQITKSHYKNKAKDKIKFYQAPQVLVGQSESQKSLVWTIGVIIDQLFVGKSFYQKFAQILGPKNNYQFKMTDCGDIGKILEHMIVKDKAQRSSLEDVESEFARIVE